MNNLMTIPFISLDPSIIAKNLKGKIKTTDNIYSVLNQLTNFSWNYTIENIRFANSETECYATIKLNIGNRSMLGVGNNNPTDIENLQESAIQNSVHNALEKMFAYEDEIDSSAKEEVIAPVILHEVQPEAHTIKEALQNTEPIYEASTPAKKASAFTSTQIAKMQKFKEDFNVMNDEQLLAHLRTWNNLITSKTQLNSVNIESFLKYVDDLSEEAF